MESLSLNSIRVCDEKPKLGFCHDAKDNLSFRSKASFTSNSPASLTEEKLHANTDNAYDFIGKHRLLG